MSTHYGKLYVVATPIGNLADITFRAIDTLKQVDLIAAEDTRHIQMLLNHYGISNKVTSLHQHNEEKAALVILDKLKAGLSVALVSDAGTPLFSDPGMPLVKLAKENHFDVIPIPGACAFITALSVSGLPITPCYFVGFIPRTSSARKTFFSEYRHYSMTWGFYESSHRILATLQDMIEIFPETHEIVIARELTKLHETVVKGSLSSLLELVTTNDNMRKGEFVVLVSGTIPEKKEAELTVEQENILRILLKECSIKTAVAMAVEITGVKKNILYQIALTISQKE